MQFLIIAYDYTDSEALQRRMNARGAHIELGDRLRKEGRHLYGAAILNGAGNMSGSMLVVDFENRAALENWLKVEPYVTGKVWEKVHIETCKVGPSFANLKPEPA